MNTGKSQPFKRWMHDPVPSDDTQEKLEEDVMGLSFTGLRELAQTSKLHSNSEWKRILSRLVDNAENYCKNVCLDVMARQEAITLVRTNKKDDTMAYFKKNFESTNENTAHEVTYMSEVYSDGFSLETILKVDLDGDSDLGHLSVPVHVPIKGYKLDDGLVKALGGYEHKDSHIFIRALEKAKALLPKEEGATVTALVNLAYITGWQECYRQWEEWDRETEQKGYFHA